MFSQDYRTLRTAAGLVDRSRALVRLTGSDRRSYLQGLLTNDILALTRGTGCYATLLTPQGRMIADMRVLETGDAVLIDLAESVAAAVRDRLEQLVFSEDVTVADGGGSGILLGVYGPLAAETVSRALDGEGSSGDDAAALGRLRSMRTFDNTWWDCGGVPVLVVRSDEIGVDGFDVVVPRERSDALRAALRAAGALDVSAEAVHVCRIEAGRPLFGEDMDGDTIPLEAGIEDRAISQTKGCYVGQEIIIRVLHRGHGRVARRLVGLTLEPGAAVPVRGDRIRAGEREVGTVTSAAPSPALGRPIALGYVHRDFVAPDTPLVILSGSHPAPAVVSRLPFRPARPGR
ncbi:MAG TPA: glycine cleavage T C-terminal barrel domain-containing protein [Vicinamibacterales bacterium]|nr:glycine cleavage T C-terminal barrel domain-containing protein [Vicinamibacterales bacterium]